MFFISDADVFIIIKLNKNGEYGELNLYLN